MTVLCLLTCYAVVLPSILNNSVLLPQSGGLHSILQDSRPECLFKRCIKRYDLACWSHRSPRWSPQTSCS